MKQRSASERCNAVIDNYNVEESCTNADYGLIRITLVNIAYHAATRYEERVKHSSQEGEFARTLRLIRDGPCGSD
jgi:hypothetical protein